MKVKTPLVAWHGRQETGTTNDPILSIDLHHTLTLATAGADNFIRIWHFKRDGFDRFEDDTPRKTKTKDSGSSSSTTRVRARQQRPEDVHTPGSTTTTLSFFNFAFALAGHERPVNVVRFSPNGECLASAGDDAKVLIWHRNTSTADTSDSSAETAWSWGKSSSEREVQYKMLRGHLDDVYDLQWSPDGRFLVSGSIDNTAIVWDVRTGKILQCIKEHSSYVQGL